MSQLNHPFLQFSKGVKNWTDPWAEENKNESSCIVDKDFSKKRNNSFGKDLNYVWWVDARTFETLENLSQHRVFRIYAVYISIRRISKCLFRKSSCTCDSLEISGCTDKNLQLNIFTHVHLWIVPIKLRIFPVKRKKFKEFLGKDQKKSPIRNDSFRWENSRWADIFHFTHPFDFSVHASFYKNQLLMKQHFTT